MPRTIICVALALALLAVVPDEGHAQQPTPSSPEAHPTTVRFVMVSAFDGIGGLERWIAGQRPWQAIPTGWTVPGELQGWRFQEEPAPDGARVVASANGGEPAMRFVPGRPAPSA